MVCVLSRTWYKEIKYANGPMQNEPQTFAFRFPDAYPWAS